MEAKDTVIPDYELTKTAEVLYNFRDAMDIASIKSVLWQLANSQARVSFEAGMREVVEFVEEEKLIKTLLYSVWQAKLNSWDIE